MTRAPCLICRALCYPSTTHAAWRCVASFNPCLRRWRDDLLLYYTSTDLSQPAARQEGDSWSFCSRGTEAVQLCWRSLWWPRSQENEETLWTNRFVARLRSVGVGKTSRVWRSEGEGAQTERSKTHQQLKPQSSLEEQCQKRYQQHKDESAEEQARWEGSRPEAAHDVSIAGWGRHM